MTGTTPTQALRYAELGDVVSNLSVKNLADDITTELAAADTAASYVLGRAAASAVNNSGGQSVSPATTTTGIFTSVQFDTNGMINLATQPSRITLQSAPAANTGMYLLHASMTPVSPPSSWTLVDVGIQFNLAEVARRKWYGKDFSTCSLSTIARATSVGNVFTMTVGFQGGGAYLISCTLRALHLTAD